MMFARAKFLSAAALPRGVWSFSAEPRDASSAALRAHTRREFDVVKIN